MNAGTQRMLSRVVFALCLFAPLSISWGDEEPETECERNARFVPTVAPGGADPCEAAWTMGGTPQSPVWQAPSSQYGFPKSACWLGYEAFLRPFGQGTSQGLANYPGAPYIGDNLIGKLYPGGSFLNIDLWAPPSIGDFLPPADTIGQSSACLVPNASASAPTGWQGINRPTVNRVVDLVTGLPLIQVEDLSLPLDGASFRLTRTRSQDAGDGNGAVDRWWDWVGEGWMISENPLLLIDSALPDVVGNQPRTTYLVLDAHHSIPFQLIESTGLYEAPARFRARMTHNGQWNAAERKWDPNGGRPTHYEIALYDGALRYTFAAVYEDVPNHEWQDLIPLAGERYDWHVSSLHERPILLQQLAAANWTPPPEFNDPQHQWNSRIDNHNPGLGLPYYGLCTHIRDQYGHAVTIDYCGFTQKSADDTIDTPECVECSQNCAGKGQIRSVTVSSSGVVQWTLMYAYRIAPPVSYDSSDEGYFHNIAPIGPDLYGRRVIDSIYVYEGDLRSDVAVAGYCEPVSSSILQGQGINDIDGIDDEVGPVPTGNLANWRHRVRYHYSVSDSDGDTSGYEPGPIESVPLLIKTSVETNAALASQHTCVETVFKYGDSVSPRDAILEAVMLPSDVDRAVELAKSNFSATWMSPNHLAQWAQQGDAPGSLDVDSSLAEAMLACASIRLGNGTTTSDANVDFEGYGTPTGPAWSTLATVRSNGSQFIKQELGTITEAWTRTMQDRPTAQVQIATLHDGSGAAHHYRFFRLAAGPAIAPNYPELGLNHQASVYYAPYALLGHTGNTDWIPYTTPPADYTQARWITIIDEFASRDEMLGQVSYGEGVGAIYGTKPGQLSRRVVEVSASGVTLRDRLWQFSEDGVVTTGDGIGEEFIYERAANILAAAGPELGLPPIPDPDSPDDRPVNYQTTEDPLAHLRNELVLVEHRSTGWSVAYLHDLSNAPGADDWQHGRSEGFVEFFEYKPYVYDGDGEGDPNLPRDRNGDGWNDDLVVSLELSAEGTKQGRVYLGRSIVNDPSSPLAVNTQGGPSLYTRQIFRPEHPDVEEAIEQSTEVRFLTPRRVDSLLAAAPAPGVVPDDCAVTHSLVYRRHIGHEDTPVPERPIRSRLLIGAPCHQRPGEEALWYFPVQRDWYSDEGATEWMAAGLVIDPLNPAPSIVGNEDLQSLTFTRYIRDSLDRPVHTITDADDSGMIRQHPDAPALQAADIGDPPDGWTRIPATGALNHVTAYRYNNPGDALSDVYFPNGRQWASRVVIISHREYPEGGDPSGPLLWNQSPPSGWSYYDSLTPLDSKDCFAREYIFNDIERRSESGGPVLYSRMLGEIRDYGSRAWSRTTGMTQDVASKSANGKPLRTRRVYFAADPSGPSGASPVPLPVGLTFTPATQPRFVEEAQTKLVLDADGRPAGATLLEANSQGAMLPVGTKQINDLVDVLRSEEIDGTITRVTKNKLGQPIRQYLGTDDRRWADPSQPQSNLVLLNRTEYGSGVNDAWLPTISREYTYHPDWANDYYGRPPSEDDDPLTVDNDGYITKTSYDWRMRPVRIDSYGENESGERDWSVAPRLSTTISILDHLDRPIIQVAFGASAGDIVLPGDDLNPCLRTPNNELADPHPDAKRYLGSSVSPRPISLVETFYEPDGSVREVRTYDVSSSESSPRWHSEYTFYGRNGAQVYAQRPESPLSKGEIDGLGRLVRQSSLVPKSENWTYELGRTDYTIDADGNIVDSARYERALFDTADSLTAEGSPNAVRTRSVSWFDPAKRQVAAADLGTEQVGGFVAGATAYDRPTNDGNLSEPYLDLSDPESIPSLTDPNNWDPDSLGLRPLLSVNHYDLATGRLTHTRNPDGSITETLYDRAGRVKSKIENRFGDASLQRRTDYGYTFGRLTKIIARRTNENVTTRDQVTTVEYGAEIVAEKREGDIRLYDIVSRRNDLVGRMSLPNSESGAATTNNDIVLRYTFRGEIAERIDARGAAIRYFYDALGRLTEEVIGRYNDAELTEFSDKHPDNMNPASGAPIDRIGYIKHTYDDAGRPRDVIAYVARDGEVVSHNRFIYDDRGNLIKEIQSHGQLIDSEEPEDVPSILYNWNYEATDDQSATQIGHNRLVSMVYPIHGQNEARVVSFNYGNNGSTDDVLSRLSGIDSKLESAGFSSPIAQFQYIGVSRRRSLRLGVTTGSITADFHLDQEVGLAGLDRFGRVQDYNFKNVSGATLFRSQYGYDTAGNRIWAQITQASVDGLSQNNVRSQLNQYNQLNQLIGTQVGTINTSNVPVSISDVIRSDTWSLDLLGNWSGPLGASSAGRFSSGNLDGGNGIELGGYQSTTFIPWEDPAGVTTGSDVTATTHFVNAQNEIDKIGTHYGNPNAGVTDVVLYDAAGNLVFDGIYSYQYDAFNRLLQLNYAHLDIEPQATPTLEDIVIDELVKHHTYDGLGRLIRTQSPYPSVDEAEDLRTERFYYDGVRRIQEIVVDPLVKLSELTQPMGAPTIELQIAATNSELSQSEAAEGNLDKSATPLAVEKVQLEGDSQYGNGAQFSETPAVRLVREYIWGPGDGVAGVDELLVQFDEDRKPWWVLQDAGGDIVALCDNGTSIEGAPFVAAQWTYDAYGSVVSADHLSPHPFMHAGHKGLFFDRLDVGVADSAVPGAEALESPRLVPFAKNNYYVRNRSYQPDLGRWLQADPNMTGLAVQQAMVYHGYAHLSHVQHIDLLTHFTDGANIYEYIGSDSWTRGDPSGLESLSALAVNMGSRAMIGGMTALFVTGLLHDSGNDNLDYRDLGLAFAFGAGGEVFIGGIGIAGRYAMGRASAAGEIGAGGRLLADDIVLLGGDVGFSVAARVSELRAAIPAGSRGRITMAVGVVEDANGVKSILIATSEPRGYLRPGVTLKPGERMVPGTGHAEADIINYANSNGLKLLDIGATRPICPDCYGLIGPTGADVSTPLKN